MKCPKCGAPTRVIETRDVARRRQCKQGHRFNSQELSADELGAIRAAGVRLIRLRKLLDEAMP